MKEENKRSGLSRRDFLKLFAAGGVTMGLKVFDEVKATKAVLADAVVDLVTSLETETSPLEVYLKGIQVEMVALEPIIVGNDLFGELKRLTPERRLEDFRTYYPMYRAAEIQYGVPWFLLSPAHTQETTASWDPYPDKWPHKGPMQRNVMFYPDDKVREAAQGWTFLHGLWQRYSPRTGKDYYDSDEIIWAASKMRADAEIIREANPRWTLEECFLEAQKSYCASWVAEARVGAYQNIKALLIENSLYSDPLQPAQV